MLLGVPPHPTILPPMDRCPHCGELLCPECGGSPSEATILYRYFDEDDILLYVGISKNGVKRLEQHLGSSWHRRIAKITMETWRSREEALLGEQLVIKTEKPIFNVTFGTRPPFQSQVGKTPGKSDTTLKTTTTSKSFAVPVPPEVTYAVPPKRGRGRPTVPNPLSQAERARRYRSRQKAKI